MTGGGRHGFDAPYYPKGTTLFERDLCHPDINILTFANRLPLPLVQRARDLHDPRAIRLPRLHWRRHPPTHLQRPQHAPPARPCPGLSKPFLLL